MKCATLKTLYRYPVKGLSPEPLQHAMLTEGGAFPGDRIFAIENGPSGFDPAAAEMLPKQRFLMLMRHPRLAKLKTRYDDATGILTLRQGEAILGSGNLATAEGCDAIAKLLERWCAGEMRGAARVLTAPPGYHFMDSRSGFVSLIDLASVAAIAEAAGRDKLDPLRFRANLYVEGLGRWGDFELVGKRVRIGDAELDIIKRIDRCAATDVDPVLGIRDLSLVALLERHFGHHDCGVYARITRSGLIRAGDDVVKA